MSSGNPRGTGGFGDPEMIVDQFGLRPGMTVADFGCGSGYFTIMMAQRVGDEGKVYALDVQTVALDSVKAKASVSSVNNIETIRTNLEIPRGSSLPGASQDFVLMANVLFQSKLKGEIIKEGNRVLKNGGTMIIIDWKKGSGGFGPPEDLRLDEKHMREIAESAGFSFEKVLHTGRFHLGMIFKKK